MTQTTSYKTGFYFLWSTWTKRKFTKNLYSFIFYICPITIFINVFFWVFHFYFSSFSLQYCVVVLSFFAISRFRLTKRKTPCDDDFYGCSSAVHKYLKAKQLNVVGFVVVVVVNTIVPMPNQWAINFCLLERLFPAKFDGGKQNRSRWLFTHTHTYTIEPIPEWNECAHFARCKHALTHDLPNKAHISINSINNSDHSYARLTSSIHFKSNDKLGYLPWMLKIYKNIACSHKQPTEGNKKTSKIYID